MKCKYCDAPLSKDDKVCPLCKKTVEEDKNEFSDIAEKKAGYKWVLGIIVVLLLGVIGFGYYYTNKPDVVFTALLNNAYKATSKQMGNYKQVKVNLDLNAKIDAGEEYKEITDLISDLSINTSVNYDLTNDRFVLGLGADYKKKSLAHANMYYEKEVMYVELKDLFDKLIKIDVKTETEKEINVTEKDINVLVEEVYKALKSALKAGEYTSSSAKVNDESVNKNTLVINNESKNQLFNAFIDYLLNSNSFIDTVSKISEMSKEEVIDGLKESKELEDLEEDIYVSIYTKKLTNEFVKAEVGTKDNVVVSLTSESENVSKLEMSVDGAKFVATVTTDPKNNKESVVYDIEAEGVKVKITMNASYVYNEEVKMPNTKGSVPMEELSEEDTNAIMTKLMENEGIAEIMDVIGELMPTEEGDIEIDDPNSDLDVNDYSELYGEY